MTHIECEEPGHCPPGFECRSTLKRCVRSGIDDVTAPGVTEIVITPKIGPSGTLQVRFQVTEPLAREPQVWIDLGGAPVFLAPSTEGAGDGYAYVFLAGAAITEGAAQVRATLVDRVGNIAEAIVLGETRFDATPPLVTGVVSMPAVARAGVLTGVEFTVGEATGSDPSVQLIDNAGVGYPMTRDATAVAPVWRYLYTTTGSEAEGPTRIALQVSDDVGNITELDTEAGPAFDFTAPRVVLGTVALAFTPPAGSPEDVSAFAAGTQVQVSFALDGPSTPPPVVVARLLPSELVLELGHALDAVYAYNATIPLGLAQGTYTVTVDTADAAGNVHSEDLVFSGQDFSLDTIAPGVPQNLLYRRAPHPRAGSIPAAFHASGRAEPNTGIVVYADAEGNQVIKRNGTDATGAFDVELPEDRPRVYVGVVDRAGNASDADDNVDGKQPTRIRKIEWTTTLADKIPGNTSKNRSALRGLTHFPGILAPEGREFGAPALSDIDGNEASTQGGGAWLRVRLGGPFEPRYGVAVAFDSRRGKLVMFGGRSDSGESCDQTGYALCGGTWEYDQGGWVRVSPLDPEGDGDPLARMGHSMAYDTDRGVVVLFGGRTNPLHDCDGGLSSICDGQWEWNGVSWRRDCAGVSCAGPPGRENAAMTYDFSRARLVLFGGATANCDAGASICDDTWVHDAGGWTPLCGADDLGPCGPSARELHAMAYDSDGQTVALVAGKDKDGGLLADVWTLEDDGWHERPTTGGSKRHSHGLIYSRNRLIVLGGDAEGQPIDDMLALDAGDTWSVIFESGVAPFGQRRAAGYALDTVRHREIVVGGQLTGSLGQTWEWPAGDEAAAVERTTADKELEVAPPAHEALAVYQPTAKTVVIESELEVDTCDPILMGIPCSELCRCSGTDVPERECFACTWRAIGPRWQREPQEPVTKPGVTARHGASLAYLPTHTGGSDHPGVVLFGGETAFGFDQEAYEWRFPNGWQRITLDPSTSRPIARRDAAMAFDGNALIVFGGLGDDACDQGRLCGDTWRFAFNSSSSLEGHWDHVCGPSTLCLPNPSPRYGHAMVGFPSIPTHVLLYGGSSGSAETWIWDGDSWSQVSPNDPEGDGNPGPRVFARMVYDANLERVLLFGGEGASNDLWAYNDATQSWTLLADGGTRAPAARKVPGLVYVADTSQLLLTGGIDTGAGGSSAASWSFARDSTGLPGHIFEVQLAEADPLFDSVLQGVDLRWTAGAVGYDSGAPSPGVTLWWWAKEWIPLIVDPFGSLLSPSETGVCLRSVDDGNGCKIFDLSRFSGTPPPPLLFAVTPAEANGTELARIETEYVEVTVYYEEP